jgi:hypothetical protein
MLLIEVQNDRQVEVLLKAHLFGSHSIQVQRRASLNFSRGIINTDSLHSMSDEEIQSTLADHFVSEAFKLIGKGDNRSFTLHSIFLTFEVPSSPAFVLVGYETVQVCPYIPDPMPVPEFLYSTCIC